MASERDLELLDDFLGNRLDEKERLAFEQKLKADPELQSEYELQQKLIEGIRKARINELKAMLNNVPVPSLHSGPATVVKLAAAAVVTAVVVAGIYYFNRTDAPVTEQKAVAPVEESISEQPREEETTVTIQDDTPPAQDQEQVAQSAKKPANEPDKPAVTENRKVTEQPVRDPALDVFDPTEEVSDQPVGTVLRVEPDEKDQEELKTATSITVETDTKNKRYNFHYQFKDSKLILYGPFEENLFEIMEFFANNKRTIFLYYQNNFYLLDDSNDKIKRLTAIDDPALLGKLKSYRGK